MRVAGQFQAPVTPSLAELNTQALDGNRDACLLLARRSASCDSDVEIAAVFDVYADAWMAVQRERTRALLNTLEMPVVEPGNLNAGWAG